MADERVVLATYQVYATATIVDGVLVGVEVEPGLDADFLVCAEVTGVQGRQTEDGPCTEAGEPMVQGPAEVFAALDEAWAEAREVDTSRSHLVEWRVAGRGH